MNRNNTKKPERISKKYQWIAFYELCAKVFDNCELSKERYSSYTKPWDVKGRDIDPTFISNLNNGQDEWWNSFSSISLRNRTAEGLSDSFPEVEKLLDLEREDKEYVNLGANYRSIRQGRRVFCEVNSILVKSKDFQDFKGLIKEQWLDREKTRHNIRFKREFAHIMMGEYPEDIVADKSEISDDELSIEFIPLPNYMNWDEQYDSSLEGNYYTVFPAKILFDKLELELDWKNYTYRSREEEIHFYDPALTDEERSPVLLASKEFLKWIEGSEFELLFLIGAEKSKSYSRNEQDEIKSYWDYRGIYELEDGEIKGELTKEKINID